MRSSPCLDRIFEAVHAAVRGPRRRRHATTTRPCRFSRSTRRRRTAPAADAEHATVAGPRTRSASESITPSAPVAVVTMADGSDDPMQIDQLTRLVERGVVVAAAQSLRAAGQQVGGPRSRRLLSRLAGCRSTTSPGSARTTRRTRSRPTPPTSCARSASRATRASRSASSSSPRHAASAAGRRDPDDLARPRLRRVELQAVGVAAAVPALVPLRVRRREAALPGLRHGRSMLNPPDAGSEAKNRNEGPRHRLGRLHRRLRRRGAARARPRRRRHRQLLQVRPGHARATTTTRSYRLRRRRLPRRRR